MYRNLVAENGLPAGGPISSRADLPAVFSDQLKLERMAPSEREEAMKKTRFKEEQMVTILREASP